MEARRPTGSREGRRSADKAFTPLDSKDGCSTISGHHERWRERMWVDPCRSPTGRLGFERGGHQVGVAIVSPIGLMASGIACAESTREAQSLTESQRVSGQSHRQSIRSVPMRFGLGRPVPEQLPTAIVRYELVLEDLSKTVHQYHTTCFFRWKPYILSIIEILLLIWEFLLGVFCVGTIYCVFIYFNINI